MPENNFCSATSHGSGEQLFGTATRADYWFVLEYPRTYGRKALEDSGLPESVKSHLQSTLAAVKNSRFQFIKKGNAYAGDGIAFFVVVNHEEKPNLYEFKLERYEDLLDLDLAGVAAEKREYWQYDRTDPLFLVCTNAKRDACCAKFGIPVFQAMQDYAGGDVWQTSHIGGHRFAATLVALPHGATYGYLAPGDAQVIVDAQRAGTVHLEKYRGRSCYEQPVQAAETFLRRELALLDLYRFKLIEIERVSESEHLYHFSDLLESKTYCARVRSEQSNFRVKTSCRDEESVRIPQFRLEEVAVYSGVGQA